jgi:hypothetical protein
VNPDLISTMVATKRTDNDMEKSMTHALVRWETAKHADGTFNYRGGVCFELVSRYTERLVAQKLSLLNTEELVATRRKLAPLSGAEGYAGALFEAYAVRKLLAGGAFRLVGLQGQEPQTLVVPPLPGPTVLECNTLSTDTVPLNTLRNEQDKHGSWSPILLWPRSTNFPTFDAFYFHTTGDAYALQATISKTHDLKSSGAYPTMKYFGLIDTASCPHNIVLVVPEGTLYNITKKQEFTGRVMDGKRVVLVEESARKEMESSFCQWLLKI